MNTLWTKSSKEYTKKLNKGTKKTKMLHSLNSLHSYYPYSYNLISWTSFFSTRTQRIWKVSDENVAEFRNSSLYKLSKIPLSHDQILDLTSFWSSIPSNVTGIVTLLTLTVTFYENNCYTWPHTESIVFYNTKSQKGSL